MRTRCASISLLLITFSHVILAAEPGPARFVGAPACSSTSCHGGAADQKNQNLIWSKRDYHSRAYATLTSARSERFAEILHLGEATKSQRCTVCHAPFQTVEDKLRLAAAKPSDGVSCESCHAPAENWLRAHTRPDFSHADRTALGMRDLKNLYVRANTCVACHQTVDSDLAAAGHPELIFELDGQSVTEPKHWREFEEHFGPKSWFIGQAVALREMSWQLSREKTPDAKLIARWSGLVWVLKQLGPADSVFVDLKDLSPEFTAANVLAVHKTSDRIAQRIAETEWSNDLTRKSLTRLCQTVADFRDAKTDKAIHARRAERLVLGLDRLMLGLEAAPKKDLDTAIERLFKLVQSLPDFEPETFAKQLSQLPPT